MHCAATFNQLAEPISYQIIHNINNDRPVQRQFSNLTVSILAVSKLADSILTVLVGKQYFGRMILGRMQIGFTYFKQV